MWRHFLCIIKDQEEPRTKLRISRIKGLNNERQILLGNELFFSSTDESDRERRLVLAVVDICGIRILAESYATSRSTPLFLFLLCSGNVPSQQIVQWMLQDA